MSSSGRYLTVCWEDTDSEKPQKFHADKSKNAEWFDDFLKYNVVFKYSEFNPRNLQYGSDAENEDEPEYEQDILAKNLDGMIGKIVDYYVHDDLREVEKTEPSTRWDYLIVDICGEKISAGFDEIQFTRRKNKDQHRKVSVNVYKYMLDESLSFMKEAFLNISKSISSENYSIDDKIDLIDDLTRKYVIKVHEKKSKPYSYIGKREIEVSADYHGRYEIFIEKDGTERLR